METTVKTVYRGMNRSGVVQDQWEIRDVGEPSERIETVGL